MHLQPLVIPTISDKRLTKLAERIRPLSRYKEVYKDGYGQFVHDKNGRLCYVELGDLRTDSFLQNFVFITRAQHIEESVQIDTFHTFDDPFIPNPTVAEVLSQIETTLYSQVCAFELISMSLTNMHEGYHRAKIQLYSHS